MPEDYDLEEPAQVSPPPVRRPAQVEQVARHKQAYPPEKPDFSQELPVKTAKASVYCALFAFFANSFGVRADMPPVGRYLMIALIAVLILGGLASGIVALVQNRSHRYPGVSIYAIIGIAINGLFLGANIVVLVWGRSVFQ